MKKTEKESRTLENSFEELEEILRKMQGEEISLEESFGCYEQGMKLVKQINESLDLVEKKVQMITADGSLADFEE